MKPKILIIDDEEYMCWAIQRAMEQEGYEAVSATSGAAGLDILNENGASLVIVDLKMPDMDGIEVLKRIKKNHPKIPVILITAHGTIETAIEAMKIGASDYITKPFDLDELVIVVKKTLQVSKLMNEVRFLRSELTKEHGTMIGESPAFVEVKQLIEKVAPTDAPVLITGESGTGKEVAAVALHNLSHRKEEPFVAINCAALPEHLLESELFGHEKGAFTGATSKKLGRFQLADKGTIFLDEIAEMSPSMQAKLLRFLQNQTFERVGGTKTIKTDTRIIAATNRDLKEAVQKGLFREDLYYRLNVITIHLPPLRERKDDIPLLARHFITTLRTLYHDTTISPDALALMQQYHWPGNIRELRNVIERALILCTDNRIRPCHLPKELQNTQPVRESESQIDLPPEGINLDDVERQLIHKALERANGNQTQAARLLGITRATLIYRMQKYGL
ncbi:MAG: sigma-54-dependent Fis family transcriptional regulator [Peptococcaceae bacterium]|nr:sigma-54-dependent Fis family transcriptional regulator [Peptococcaceae bacterium]